MQQLFRFLGIGGAALFLLAPLAGKAQISLYQQTDLVTDDPALVASLGYPAAVNPNPDPNLVNPWGISFSAKSPFWISDNNAGMASIYDGSGTPIFSVTIPSPGPVGSGGTGGTPTGQVFNGSSGFGGDHFIFATEDGTISGWNGGPSALIAVPAANGAVFKGLALANNQLFATDFHNGKVLVFDSNFNDVTPAGSFQDPSLPAGYAPFNVQLINGQLYVTYAKQKGPDNHDDDHGPGRGFVDIYTTGGVFVKRFAAGSAVGGTLDSIDSPWGLALAPSNFGQFSNDLLVGNFGNGQIDAFDSSDNFVGQLLNTNGAPVMLNGLWGLAFGNGFGAGLTNNLYFTAGIGDESHGLFGSLQAVPEPGSVAALFLGTLSTAGFLLRRRTRKSKS